MSKEILIFAASAASLGFIHTLFGPDHYLPFIMMARARRWNLIKTSWITFLCGLGHVGSSVIVGAIGACGFVLALMQSAERMRRFFAFLNPDSYPDEAYQLKQSVDAFILGGGFGTGLGRSLQKHSYLPEAHTDFILAIIGEELGVGATLLVVALFIGLLICGMIISMRAVDPFGRLVGFGLTTMIILQASINIGVVTGCLPTKGLPLPFISAGGSNLIMCVFSVGVMLNIARHSSGESADKHTRTIKDSVHDA